MYSEFIEELNESLLESFLAHHGVGWDDNPPGIGSGRYPHGSGENPYQHDFSLGRQVSELKKKGMSTKDIYTALGYKSSGELRAAITIEKERKEHYYISTVPAMRDSGLSIAQIAEKTGLSQSSVRNYLKDRPLRVDKTSRIASMLRDEVGAKNYIDIGSGVEVDHAGGSRPALKAAVEMLKMEGYNEYNVKVPQLGTNHETTIHVLAAPGADWKTVKNNPTLIKTIDDYILSEEAVKTSTLGMLKPASIDSSRVYINYTNPDGTGGAEKDGLIELRRGVEDISLGRSSYAQVRIAVDDTHYMKGMAVYSDDVPKGYDIIYNTNKKTGTDKYDVFKPMKTVSKDSDEIDWANPFGANIKSLDQGGQSYILDKDGNPTDKLRVINKVTDQGDWLEWKKQISAQVLGKQSVPLIKRQLDLTYKDKELEFKEIMALENPTVKRKLLESFADDLDASAVHLKAKAFPGQASFVALPIPSLEGGTEDYKRKHGVDGEIYAPRYENGIILAAIRYPHAGTFEIPLLRVNNNNKEAKSVLGQAPDAVGYNAKIAQRLSGADFDGDTVTIIPCKDTNILSTPPFKELVNFDTKLYTDPMAKANHKPTMTAQQRQQEMGKTTNLIADMQYKDAPPEDLVKAVKHSMVVVDAEKHYLNWKQSEIDNDIQHLKDRYQGGGGVSTLVTRSKNETHPLERKLGTIAVNKDTGEKFIVTDKDAELPKGFKKYYGIDPLTGEKVLVDSGRTKKVFRPTQKEPNRWIEVPVREKSTRMADARTSEDVYNLMSSRDNPHPAELAYANYAIRVKELANQARKEMLSVPRLKKDPQAAKEYAKEVGELKSALDIALKHSPVERQAQIIAGAEYKMRLKANPDIAGDKAQCKRLKGQCLSGARLRLGGKKQRIDITDKQWEAIQHRAVSESVLEAILKNTDADALKKRATPRNNTALSESKKATAIAWANAGYSQEEIAQRLGVSPTTIARILNE